MARLIESVSIAVDPQTAWAAVGDIGGLEQSVPQLVAKCDYDEAVQVRTVTFTNGASLVEPIVARDEAGMTLVWTAQGGEWTHHNASMQVIPDAAGNCSVCWTADVLPDDQAPTITGIMQGGLAALKETLESAS